MADTNGFEQHEASAVMGVKAFHQSAGRLDVIRKRELEEAKFIDPETGLLHSWMQEFRNCPTCDRDNYAVSFVKQGFKHCLCSECHTLYVNPIVSKDALVKHYEKSESTNATLDQYLNPLNRQFDEPKFKQALDLIKQHSTTERGLVLDIGCSAGHFLEIARQNGWDGKGIELSQVAADYAENLGFEISRSPLEAGSFKASEFDAVTMWDLFEHLPNPNETLQILQTITKADGLLGMIIPNSDSLAARVMRDKCNMFIGSKHLNFFNKTTLERILKKNGFEVLHLETFIGEVNAINNYLNYEHPYLGSSSETKKVLGLIDTETLLQNHMGYKIFCIARKTS